MQNPNFNYSNLARMADYIETIPQKMFDMIYFIELSQDHLRNPFAAIKKEGLHDCNTVGCTIGHCVVLDTNIPRMPSGNYDYNAWAYRFTGISALSLEFSYLFGSIWAEIDNTPQGAAQRIRTFIASGVPENYQ